ncbi:MAG: ATP-binding protein [Candidatus Hadarchaeales archaeon]
MENQATIPRDLTQELKKWIHRPECFAIRGPRQSGKTTLLKILAKELEKIGRVIFLNFEDPDVLRSFEEDPLGYVKSFISGEERHFFLMDEYHYVREPGKKLKLLYDSFQQVKFIVTGSSSLELSGAMGRYLVGRVFFFELFPLSFHEFLLYKDPRLAEIYVQRNSEIRRFVEGGKASIPEKDVFIREIDPLFQEYLTFGGYPAVVTAGSLEEKRMVLKGIYDTYVSRDVIEFLRFGDAFRYRDAVRALAASTGNLLNCRQLASDLGSYFREIRRILSILSETYIIELVRPYFKNPRTELKKVPKVYFVDTGLRNYVLGQLLPFEQRIDQGALAENGVLISIGRSFPEREVRYWRTIAKTEVDFVLLGPDPLPLEVKYGRVEPKVPPGLKSFIRAHSPERAMVATRELWSFQDFEGTEVLFVPACYL